MSTSTKLRQELYAGDLMAQNDINVNLNVSSNGSLDTEAKKAEKLSAALKTAERASLNTSKALASAKASTTPAARAKVQTLEEEIDYGISRAAVGTGAAGRDFAKQSQGLGGLVRLYATFAANIFAVSAAYTALSNAADTANLVKGLDQLGAASGKGLGTLAKRLTEASQGAISLRDSMESVAKASSAGLSDAQILKIGDAARQASQALGVAMPDALNRLTRGIAKLEPELLDELGIFVRIDDAVRSYATSVGKSAASLTDFERRQAFANAVLTQAEKKFSEIDLDVNPYAKLLATLQNVSFAGLDLINKVLGPLVKLLSESPTALGALLFGISAKLVSSAIPAISQWREGLKFAAEDAKLASEKISKSFGDTFQTKLESFFKIPNLKKALDEVNLEIAKSLSTRVPVRSLPASLLKDAPSLGNLANDEASLTKVNNLLKTRNEYLETGFRGQTKVSAANRVRFQEEVASLKTVQLEIIKEIELEKLRAKQKAITAQLEKANDSTLAVASQKQSRVDPELLAIKQAEKARLNYDKVLAVSNAAETTRVLGLGLAWQGLNKEVAEKGITGLDKYTTLAKGGLASVATRVAGIATSFSSLIPIAAAAYAGYELLSFIFSKNTKESAAFNGSAEETNKAVKVLEDTLTRMSKKSLIDQADIASFQALSNAIGGVANNAEKLVNSLDKADKTASWFDKYIDGQILSVFDKDLRSTFTREFSLAVTDSFAAMPESDAKKTLEDKLKSIYSVSKVTADTIRDSIDSLDVTKVVSTNKMAAEALSKYSESLKKSSDALVGFKETLEASTTAYLEMSNSLTSSDPISKLGQSLMASGTAITNTLANTTTGVTGLLEILNDSRKLSLLPDDARSKLLEYSSTLKSTSANIKKYQAAISEAEKQLEQLKQEEKESTVIDGGTGNKIVTKSTQADQLKVQKNIQSFYSNIKEAQARQAKIVSEFSEVGRDIFRSGVDLMMRQISSARASAALTVFKAQTQQATGFAKTAIDSSIQKQEIDIQLKLLDVQEALVVQQTKTNLLLTERALAERVKDAQALRDDRGLSQEGEQELALSTTELRNVKLALIELRNGLAGINLKTLPPGVAEQLGPLRAQAAASTATRIKLGADRTAINITKEQQDQEQSFQNAQKTAKQELDLLNITKTRTAALSSLVGIENFSLLLLKQKAELAVFDKQTAIEKAEVDRNILVQQQVYSAAVKARNEVAQTGATKEIEALREQSKEFDKRIEKNRESNRITQETERIESRYLAAQRERENNKELDDLDAEMRKNQLKSSEEFLSYLTEIKAISEETGIIRKAALEEELLQQERLTQERSITFEAENARRAADFTKGKASLAAGNDEKAKNAINKSYLDQLTQIDELEKKRLGVLEAQTKAKSAFVALLAKENAGYAKINSIGSSLEKIFNGIGESASKFGTGLSNVVKTFASISQRRVAIELDTKKKLEKINTDNIDGVIEYASVQHDAAKESAKAEVDYAAEAAGAAKSMFSEKTFAFKAFAAVERAIHVAKITMMAMEVAASLATVGPTVAAEGAKSAAKGKGAILSALNAPWPINFVAGAMMAAIVASLLGGSASKVAIPAGVTAEDRQEVQGTGLSFVNGKKVENGNGVFGDSSAKSESISKSLELLASTSVEGLSYTTKMVSLLTKISEGINGAAKALYSIPGIRTGSQFGTQEGSNSSGIKGLFGKTTTKEIVDSGIKITGSFSDLINGISGVIKGYETVSVTVKKSGLFGLGGSTSTSIQEQYVNLDKAVTSQITEVFQHATDLFIDAGGKLGITAENVLNQLGNIKVDQLASLKDLTGEDLVSELNAILGNILDSAANTVFASLDKYKEFGEGMLETVVRVIDSNEKLKQSLDSIGRTATSVSFEISESLVKMAGGLDQLLDITAEYKNNYLSEAEQLIPIQKTVTEQLKSLGFSSVQTKDDIKFLVNGLDLASEGGQAAYIQLLKLSSSFDRIAQAAEVTDNLRIDLMEAEGKTVEATALRRQKELKAMSATDAALQLRIWLLEDEKDLVVSGYSYQLKILQLLGKNTQALALARAKELNEMEPQLRSVQEYIFAIEDEIEIREKATKAVESTISSLKNSMSSLKDLRSSLLGGDKSILTPQEKYAEAKREAMAIIEAASAPASSIEDVLVREAAISKLPEVTGTWLEASRNLYASSVQYTSDFNTILSAIDSTSAFLDSQLTDAEKQLQAIKDSSNILSAIDENTLVTADLVKQLLVSAEATRLAMVTVPENVVTPGTSLPTLDIPGTPVNQDLVAELIKFNKEALEKQLKAQEEATAAIIRSNAAAEAAAAAAIIAAQKEAIAQADWAKKNTPVLDMYYGDVNGGA